ncbi:MAG: hypothetical protein ACRBN8_42445 [Nannocystales bacterium]
MSARPFVQRFISPTLAVALACPAGVAVSLAPTVVNAAPPAADEEAQLAEAREMFERGRSKYDTFDYEGAIDVWQQAMAKVPENQAGVRNAMVYNIALAREKAFDVDKDVAHLRQAVLLLEQWVGSYKAMFKKTPETEAEVGKAQKRIQELNARIKRIEAGEDTTTGVVATDQTDPGTSIEFDTGYTPPPEVMREQKKAKANNRAEGMIAIGWTVGGIGALVLLSGTAATIGTASTAEKNGLGASIGTAVFGAAMVVTGGVLLGKGYKQKKANEQGQYSVAPYFNRHGGGAAFSMRF